MARQSDKILCRTPSKGKKGTNIDRHKYKLIRSAILKVVPRNKSGIAFRDLPSMIEQELSPLEQKRIGSVMWYTVTVKLHMEVIGELERVANCKPQRIRRVS